MKEVSPSKFMLGIVAAILGITLIKDFDFEHLKFAEPALDIIYLIVLISSVYLLLKTPNIQ